MAKGTKINVNETQITVITENKIDFISFNRHDFGFQ